MSFFDYCRRFLEETNIPHWTADHLSSRGPDECITSALTAINPRYCYPLSTQRNMYPFAVFLIQNVSKFKSGTICTFIWPSTFSPWISKQKPVLCRQWAGNSLSLTYSRFWMKSSEQVNFRRCSKQFRRKNGIF